MERAPGPLFPPFAGMTRIRFGGSRPQPPLSPSSGTPRRMVREYALGGGGQGVGWTGIGGSRLSCDGALGGRNETGFEPASARFWPSDRREPWRRPSPLAGARAGHRSAVRADDWRSFRPISADQPSDAQRGEFLRRGRRQFALGVSLISCSTQRLSPLPWRRRGRSRSPGLLPLRFAVSQLCCRFRYCFCRPGWFLTLGRNSCRNTISAQRSKPSTCWLSWRSRRLGLV